MPLPADIARCPGHIISRGQVAGSTTTTISFGQAECARCRRREPVPDGAIRSVHIAPPEFVDGKCPSRIAP